MNITCPEDHFPYKWTYFQVYQITSVRVKCYQDTQNIFLYNWRNWVSHFFPALSKKIEFLNLPKTTFTYLTSFWLYLFFYSELLSHFICHLSNFSSHMRESNLLEFLQMIWQFFFSELRIWAQSIALVRVAAFYPTNIAV